MFSQIVQNILLSPLSGALTLLSTYTGNIGIGIVALTLLIRFALTPFSLPAIRSQKKMTELKPHLDELKRNYDELLFNAIMKLLIHEEQSIDQTTLSIILKLIDEK